MILHRVGGNSEPLADLAGRKTIQHETSHLALTFRKTICLGDQSGDLRCACRMDDTPTLPVGSSPIHDAFRMSQPPARRGTRTWAPFCVRPAKAFPARLATLATMSGHSPQLALG